MQTFPGKLRFPQDASRDVAADISISDGVLQIKMGDIDLGEWPIDSLDFERGVNGYHVTLDSEDLILSPNDSYAFGEAIDSAKDEAAQSATPRSRRKKAKQEKAMQKEAMQEKAMQKEQESSETSHSIDEQSPSKKRFKRRPKPTPEPAPTPVPQVEGPKNDSENDSVDETEGTEDESVVEWATSSIEEPATLGDRLNSRSSRQWLAIVSVVIAVVLAVFAPNVLQLVLMVPGVVAVILASLGILDPSFTRFLPAKFSELRLLIIGIGFFLAALLLAAFR